jgi:membrane protein insertase Oxa1/YidC/SpoIIIJ
VNAPKTSEFHEIAKLYELPAPENPPAVVLNTESVLDPVRVGQVANLPGATGSGAPVRDSSVLFDLDWVLYHLRHPAISLAEMMQSINESGVPWWVTVPGLVVTLRVLLLPLAVSTMNHAYRQRQARPEIEMLAAKLKAKKQTGTASAEDYTKYTKDLKKVMQKHNTTQWSTMRTLVNIPIWMLFFLSARWLSVNDPSLITGGILWFTDLTVR